MAGADLSAEVAALHRESPLTDVHAHPSLKAYLFGRDLWRHYRAGPAFDPFASRTDFPTLERGGVGVLWAAHHLPERELFRRCCPIAAAAFLFSPVAGRLTRGSPFGRLNEMMDRFEAEVARRPERTGLARSAAEVRALRAAGRIAFVHAVEGAHVLEGRLEHLDALAARGVAALTLAHFFDNGVAEPVDGIPRDLFVRRLCRLAPRWRHPAPLTEFGRAVVRRAGELGIILDLTHCTPPARAAVFAEAGRRRPLMATHVGVRARNADPYNLADDEIRAIAATGGAVGVIFMTYWLDAARPRHGLDAIWATVEHVQHVTGSFDHVVLGTDFDGFTDPPDDVRSAAALGKVTARLLARGVPPPDVRKILGGNAQRILEAGWTGTPSAERGARSG